MIQLTPTRQVNAAVWYLIERKACLIKPINEIGYTSIRQMNLKNQSSKP